MLVGACAAILAVDDVGYASDGGVEAGTTDAGGSGDAVADDSPPAGDAADTGAPWTVRCADVPSGTCSGSPPVCCTSNGDADVCLPSTDQVCHGQTGIQGRIECDDFTDCLPNRICCLQRSGSWVLEARCVPPSNCSGELACDKANDVCDGGRSCMYADQGHIYSSCQ